MGGFTPSVESWTTDRKAVNTSKQVQLDIGSSSIDNGPLYLKAAHQKTQRIDPYSTTNPPANLSNDRFNNAIVDETNVRQNFVENDSMRYTKDLIMTISP